MLLGGVSIGTAIAIDPPGAGTPGTAWTRVGAGGLADEGTPPRSGNVPDAREAGVPLVRSEATCTVPVHTTPPTYRHPGAGLTTEAATARHPRDKAVFLGDSYTSGYEGVGEDVDGWPARVGSAMGWQVQNLAVPGTGFANPGWTGQPFRALVDETIAARPSIVVLAGGHNDERYGPDRVADAADAVLDRLRTGLPNAVLVVIGPIWPDADPVDAMLALRDHLRLKARGVEAVFIDPIADGWFTGPNHGFIGADRIHPTAAGYRQIAALVLAALRADPRFSPPLAEAPEGIAAQTGADGDPPDRARLGPACPG